MHHDPSLQHSEVRLEEQATETTGLAGRADGVWDKNSKVTKNRPNDCVGC
jgi:hypothetical protein